MTTTLDRDAALTRATTPYALSGLASHLLDFDLPAPETIELRRGHVRVWILAQHASAWKARADVIDARHELRSNHHVHIVDAVLHGSCVRVQLRWIRFVDHAECAVCGVGLCFCRDLDEPCEGTVSGACAHSEHLCADDQGQCSQCRDDLRQDRAEGWSVR